MYCMMYLLASVLPAPLSPAGRGGQGFVTTVTGTNSKLIFNRMAANVDVIYLKFFMFHCLLFFFFEFFPPVLIWSRF